MAENSSGSGHSPGAAVAAGMSATRAAVVGITASRGPALGLAADFGTMPGLGRVAGRDACSEHALGWAATTVTLVKMPSNLWRRNATARPVPPSTSLSPSSFGRSSFACRRKDVLRCRVVTRSSFCETSTHKFLLAHHHRQPWLPILQHFNEKFTYLGDVGSEEPRLVVLRNTHSSVVSCKIWPIVQHATHGSTALDLHAACDGLLLVSSTVNTPDFLERRFYILNPATRRFVALKQVSESLKISESDPDQLIIHVVGFSSMGTPQENTECFTMCNGGPPAATSPFLYQVWTEGLPFSTDHDCLNPPVLYRGGLHWVHWEKESHIEDWYSLVVFDTAAETSRSMRQPTKMSPWTALSEMNDTIVLCGIHADDSPRLDFWVHQDYEAELWDFKYRINLWEVVASPPLSLTGNYYADSLRAALLSEHQILIQLGGRMFLCGVDGKFLRDVERENGDHFLQITWQWHQESIMPLPVMPEEENKMPFLLGMYNAVHLLYARSGLCPMAYAG
ncbi:hypothetical protein ACP70R_011993 [Stipagrostis hirtigluma subsp. patula]